MQPLSAVYSELLQRYNADETFIAKQWLQLEKAYTGRKRYYHNLQHLTTMLEVLTNVKHQVEDWDCLLFSLFYHDVVYNVLKQDNEAKSAEEALKLMTIIGCSEQQQLLCKAQILATKTHTISNNTDINLFTDADLCILGMPTNIYSDYCKAIRKEYGIYPDFMYQPGRQKVVAHFLAMPRIYKTDYFFEEFEEQARKNLQRESIQIQ
jgi:predicted metal-dependent HD superfamily phosphohydrolase